MNQDTRKESHKVFIGGLAIGAVVSGIVTYLLTLTSCMNLILK